MSHSDGFAETCAHLLHEYFIWIVVASYGAAAFMPQLGETLRSWRFLNTSIAGMSIVATTPTILLAMLLFNASLVANIDELKTIARRPVLALGGLVGNFASPLACIFVGSVMLRLWHNSDETQQLLTGLAFVAAMPIAGASTAWAQSANGNMSLSIGLVLATTLFSPALTPLVLHAAGAVTTGDYSEDLHEIAAGESANFLGLWVLAPSLFGLAAGRALSDNRVATAKPFLKIANYAAIVILNYANASLSLPGVLRQPDADFLVLMMFIVFSLCLTAFAIGFLIARVGGADRRETASLMFGLGMNNNGAGLMLASTTMADHPGVLLPVILYNLIQHFVAALVDRLMFQERDGFV